MYLEHSSNSETTSENDKYFKELEYFNQLHREKYTDKGQTREDHCAQLANRTSSDSEHYNNIYKALYWHRFLPAGRVQAALGASSREVSPFNCSVSQRIDDSIDSIMAAQSNAVKILRLGTGIGYNFSHLRPKYAEIVKLKTQSSGPLSFMEGFNTYALPFMGPFDAMSGLNVYAGTIASAGHRRGAQMAVMNVDHPDIEAFIDAKMVPGAYRQFNFSVGITDAFMEAVKTNSDWPLQFEGKIFKTISAVALWEKIVRNAYASAEPGILFLDRFNQTNNLYYCEHIEATNPCSEQPLPPYGLCLLGSHNLVAYLYRENEQIKFDFQQFTKDVRIMVEAYDNIFDEAVYAIPEHREEAINKRRMGLGLTGIANAIELMVGLPSYGNEEFCLYLDIIAKHLTVSAYTASIELAKKRGPFKYFDRDKYLQSVFVKSLPDYIQDGIYKYGIRNSHLISYAPCGTISQIARNVSSGVEPVFHHQMDRDVYMQDGKKRYVISDFAYREYKFKCKTLEDCSIEDHLRVAEICQRYCDSAVSKTVNVASNCSYEEYENVYLEAYDRGLKGITVYRPTELRGSVIKKAEKEPVQLELPLGDLPVQLELPHLTCANGMCER